MLRASIDLGTNTCLLLIAVWDPLLRQPQRVMVDRVSYVRLGQKVDQTHELQPEAMERTLSCLSEYADQVRAAGIDPRSVTAVATSQARDARNGAEFFLQIERKTGFQFRTLSGDDEAQYTFLGGLLPGQDAEMCAVIDIGGGSTELMSTRGGKSLDLGSVRFTERFFLNDPVSDEEFWRCQQAIDLALEGMNSWRISLPEGAELVGVAGTVTSIAAWSLGMKAFDSSRIDGCELTRGDIHRFVEELKWRTIAERRELAGVEAQRADVLLAGSMILWRTMELLSFSSVKVSTRGLRYGVLGISP